VLRKRTTKPWRPAKLAWATRFFVFVKNVAKQLVLITKGILKLNDSKGKTLGG
jgi:hypothetical protein